MRVHDPETRPWIALDITSEPDWGTLRPQTRPYEQAVQAVEWSVNQVVFDLEIAVDQAAIAGERQRRKMFLGSSE